MNKVLIITYYWPPSGGAGVQRWLKFSKFLPEYGWEPIILTVDPDFASYPQIDNSLNAEIPKDAKIYRTKTFEVYNIYRKLSNSEVPYGGFSNEQKQSFVQKTARFIRGNFFIPDPRKGWNKYAIKKAKALIKEHDISTVITTSPPHSTQLIGLKLKKELNVKWIADLRDPWTDIYYYSDLRHLNITSKIDKKLELKVLETSDSVITVSDGVRNIFHGKIKNQPIINVITNGFDEDDFKVNKKAEINKDLVITYTGTISEKYDLSTFIQALRQLINESGIKLILRFIGSVPAAVRKQIEENIGVQHVNFVGYVPHQVSIEQLFTSDLLLLVIPKTKNNDGIITGKIFEYLAVKKPIICLGPINGDAAKIIRECNSGETFDYNDFTSIYNFLVRIVSKQPLNYNFSSDKYSRKALTKKLAEVLNSLDQNTSNL
jgi:hypothetical protein